MGRHWQYFQLSFILSMDLLAGFQKYSYYCSGRPPILKANQVNRLSPMTAVEMAFWRCTGQCIWIWPVCYYRYVKNEKHSDLFYKPSYVLTYALVSPTYAKLSNSNLNSLDNCGLCSNWILFPDITSHGRCCRKLFRNTNIDCCHIDSL